MPRWKPTSPQWQPDHALVATLAREVPFDPLLHMSTLDDAFADVTRGNDGHGGPLVRQFAPPDVRERVLAKFASGEWAGETIQSLTERTGGSDLAELETTATPDGDAWRLNGFKWFASNANGQAWVVLAKPEGAPDTARGIATFLVLRERRDGARNGIRIRRLKEKLGTRAVASAEVEFVDAEAFLLSGRGDGEGGPGYTIRDELNERPYLRGTVGMALDPWPDTGGSQFFITHSPQPHLDAKYTAFGRVVAGMEVVDQLEQTDVIRRVRISDAGQTVDAAK